tara:strand:- start:333 stop:698 length:366 start_codon:yes stop_codon:yes gene_type:complete
MGYDIEVSFKIKTGNTYTKCNNILEELIEKNGANHHYYISETIGTRKIERNNRIAYINFESIDRLRNFTNSLKKEKHFYIDCITSDETQSTILYASSYYLTYVMSKEGRKMYKDNKNTITI